MYLRPTVDRPSVCLRRTIDAYLLGLGHADVVIAMLREALTRPRYDAPLPVPDLTDRAVRHIQAQTPRPGR